MATARPDDVEVREAISAILAPVLSEPGAGARRATVLRDDERATEEMVATYEDLDALLDVLCQRFAEAAEQERERAEEAAAAAVEAELAVVIDETEIIEIAPDDDELAGAAAVEVDEVEEIVEAAPAPTTRPYVPKKRKDHGDPVKRAAGLLYDDLLWLLSINDGEGALISLERLMVLTELSGEVSEFIALNQEKLLQLYENQVGPFEKVPSLAELEPNFDMPEGYRENERIGTILALVNGKTPVKKLLKKSPYGALETCCILNQLKRSGLVTLQ